MMYFASAIHTLYPNVVRTVGEEAFDIDGNPVEYDRTAVVAKAAQMQAQQQRAGAYAAEADPLFFKAQRGEVSMDDWTAKVEEIRTRYPYPTEAEK